MCLLPAPPAPLVRLKRRGLGLSPAWEEAKGLSPLNPRYTVACGSSEETKCFHSLSFSASPWFLSFLWRLSLPLQLCPAGTCNLKPACVVLWWLLSAVRDLGEQSPHAGAGGLGALEQPSGTSSPSWGWTKRRGQAGLQPP